MSSIKVSILIAVRNEEQNLPELLESLKQLTYDPNLFEICFGNDDSTDRTSEILESFVKTNKHAWVLNVGKRSKNEFLDGKARVLEKLAENAQGDFYFFTDADVKLPARWIESMLAFFNDDKVGITIGISTMPPKPFLQALQGIEWLNVLYLMHLLGKFNIASTGMGNNMAVSKTAYWATGGYKKIGFSILEDLALYTAIVEQEFNFKHAFSKEVLVMTKAPLRFFEQRKRWLSGGFKEDWALMLPGLLLALIIPFFLILGFLNVSIALYSILGISLLNTVFIGFFQRRLGLKGYLPYAPIFFFYLAFAWPFQFIYLLFPGKVVWKGRNYVVL